MAPSFAADQYAGIGVLPPFLHFAWLPITDDLPQIFGKFSVKDWLETELFCVRFSDCDRFRNQPAADLYGSEYRDWMRAGFYYDFDSLAYACQQPCEVIRSSFFRDMDHAIGHGVIILASLHS